MRSDARGRTTVVARLVGRRAVRSGLGWGAVFGVYVGVSALGYATAYPTAAERHQLAVSLGSNAGLAALLGPARAIDTVAGFTAWRCLGVLSLVGAVWGILTGTRLLRGEEDAGRWELLLAGATTRRRAAVQGAVAVAAGWLALAVATAGVAILAGRRVDPPIGALDSAFLGLSVAASAAVFLAVAMLAGQLAASRRQAAAISAGVFGMSMVLRMIADSGTGLSALRWLTPLGWIEELHPMTGARPGLFPPIAATVVLLGALAVGLAGRRDLGAGLLAAHDTAPPRTRLLSGPLGLSFRLARPAALGWIAGIGGGGLLLGLVAKSAADTAAGSSSAQQIMSRLGAPRLDATSYLGIAFIFVVLTVCMVAAGQVAHSREEEADGRLESLLVRPVGRVRWLAGRLAVAAAVVVACALAAGALAWAGAALQSTGVSLGDGLRAGLNTVPAAIFVLGLGTLVHGVAPRLTSVVSYGVLAWSFLVELIGTAVKASPWVLDTSLLHHVAAVPAVGVDWGGAAGLAGLGAIAAVLGAIALQRRDLVSA